MLRRLDEECVILVKAAELAPKPITSLQAAAKACQVEIAARGHALGVTPSRPVAAHARIGCYMAETEGQWHTLGLAAMWPKPQASGTL